MKGEESGKKYLYHRNYVRIFKSSKLVNLKAIQPTTDPGNMIKNDELTLKHLEPVNQKKIINEINNNFYQYLSKEIPIHKCLASTSFLTTYLLNFHSDFKIAKQAYNESLLNISCFYTILHMDIYTGNGFVDKNFNCDQLIKLYHRTLDEITKNWRIGEDALDQIKSMSVTVLKNLNNIYYNFGLEGCFTQLVQTLFKDISNPDYQSHLSEEKIGELISSVQAEKFLCTFNFHS